MSRTTHARARAGRDDPAMSDDTSWVRTALSYGLVVLGPAAAWLVWVSRSVDKASDMAHVAWFVTVAVCCFAAGVLAPRRRVLFAPLLVLAPVAALVVLYLWWSTEEEPGFYLIGIAMAAVFLPIVGTALLLLGRTTTATRARRRT